MKFYLIVAKGRKKGMPIPIVADLFLIGSDDMCQLQSRHLPSEHCALILRDNKIYVRDMGTGSPTLVNGNAIAAGSEWPLHAGDRLEVGRLEFLIQFIEKNLSERDLEEWAASCLDEDSSRDVYRDESLTENIQSRNASDAAAFLIDQLNAEKGAIKGRLRIGLERGFTVVRLNDRKLVDESEIAFIKKELCENLQRPNMRVVLDCKNLERVSTAGVLMIRELSAWVKNSGSAMAVCRVRPDLRSMLIAFSQDRIPVFDEKTEALGTRWW